jgi:hypothetical protein
MRRSKHERSECLVEVSGCEIILIYLKDIAMNKLLAVLMTGFFALSMNAFAADNAKPTDGAKPAAEASKAKPAPMSKKAHHAKKATDKAAQ